jgi:midasin
MVSFTCRVARETGELRSWGSHGGPWEMNLRDLSRWAAAAKVTDDCNLGPGVAAKLIYVERMRTPEDRAQVRYIFNISFIIVFYFEVNKKLKF